MLNVVPQYINISISAPTDLQHPTVSYLHSPLLLLLSCLLSSSLLNSLLVLSLFYTLYRLWQNNEVFGPITVLLASTKAQQIQRTITITSSIIMSHFSFFSQIKYFLKISNSFIICTKKCGYDVASKEILLSIFHRSTKAFIT